MSVLNFLSEETFIDYMSKANEFLKYISDGVGVGFTPSSPAEIQALVRSGRHKDLIPVGSQIITSRNNVPIVFDVIGANIDTPSDPQFTNSLTLLMHEPYDFIQFCAPQAMYYAEEELPAGTYNVTPKNGWSVGMGNGKTYQFTLANPVPQGGQIVWNGAWDEDPLNYKINTYSGPTSTTIIETVTPTEGSSGTALTTINHPHRMCYGSNNYKESAIRQLINSDEAAGSVWTPQSKYDRPPSWNTSKDGFLKGLDTDFLSVIGKTKKKTARFQLVDTGIDETNDKFFLLSRSEFYAGNEYSDCDDGSPYPYFANYSDYTSPNDGVDKNRIKYKNGAPQWWWGRTPSSGHAYYVRVVNTTGQLSDGSAYTTGGAVVACNII